MDLMSKAQLLGNLGEFVGAIAVVVTLGYLAVQVRQNTKAEKRFVLDSSVRNLTAVRQSLFESSQMTTISYNGLNDPEGLTEPESYRFRIWFANPLMSFWHVYAQPSVLRDDLWKTQLPVLFRIMTSPGGRAYWTQHRDEFVSSFRDEIHRIVGENPNNRPFR
jgi:hypothetical protein